MAVVLSIQGCTQKADVPHKHLRWSLQGTPLAGKDGDKWSSLLPRAYYIRYRLPRSREQAPGSRPPFAGCGTKRKALKIKPHPSPRRLVGSSPVERDAHAPCCTPQAQRRTGDIFCARPAPDVWHGAAAQRRPRGAPGGSRVQRLLPLRRVCAPHDVLRAVAVQVKRSIR